MTQAVSWRPLIAHTCLRSQASTFKIYGGQHNSGTDFSTSASVCYHWSILAFMLVLLLSDGQAGEDRNLKQSNVLSDIRYCYTGK